MRLQTMVLVNTQLTEENQIKDPRQLLKFKHDEPYNPTEEIHIPTEEEWEEMDRRLAGFHAEKNDVPEA